MKNIVSRVKRPIHRFQITVLISALHLQQQIVPKQHARQVKNFAAFIFIQTVLGVQALAMAFADKKTPLAPWMISSYIFSLLIFILYKSVVRIRARAY